MMAMIAVTVVIGLPAVGVVLMAALLIALFAILVYVTFRYEFSFALGAILAIIHDVLMTLGIFFL